MFNEREVLLAQQAEFERSQRKIDELERQRDAGGGMNCTPYQKLQK